MRGLVGFIFLFQMFTVCAQQKYLKSHSCQDMIILVSKDTCGTPAVNADVSIARSDGESKQLKTDSLGRIQICECNHTGFFTDGFVYDIEVRMVNEQVVLDDRFDTRPWISTRVVRDLKFENPCKVKIDLNISISRQDSGTPLSDIYGVITRDDSVAVSFVTDSLGRFNILNGAYNEFMQPGHKYTLEIQGKSRLYMGTTDAFHTNGVLTNTRIIRNLKMIRSCTIGKPLGVGFVGTALELTEASLWELDLWFDIFSENPTMEIAIMGVYDSESELTLAWKRAELIRNELIEMGINTSRLTLEVISREKLNADSVADPFLYKEENLSDVTFQILSFDYVPQK